MRRGLTLGLTTILLAMPAFAIPGLGGGGPDTGRNTTPPGIDDTPPITWIESYPDAVKEAQDKGRPLIIFFHVANKGARMTEMGTFDDARVKARARRFVAVKIDVEVDLAIAQKYSIAMSQCVVIADPDEKKLSELEGNPNFDDVSKAMDAATKILGNPPTDKEIAELAARLEAARKAIESERYSQAWIYLKPLVESKAKCGVVKRGRTLSVKIDEAGAVKLAEAAALGKAEKWAAAMAAYGKVASQFRGTEVEKKAAAARKAIRTNPKIRAAAEADKAELDAKKILATAQAYEKRRKYLNALSSYGRVVALGETSSRAAAAESIKRLKANKKIAAAMTAEKAERKARSLWSRAGSWIRNGQEDKAIELLNELVEKHPNSDYCAKAKEKLKELVVE